MIVPACQSGFPDWMQLQGRAYDLHVPSRYLADGDIRVPGDKSCSHRALMMAGVAHGYSRVSGLLAGDDIRCTANALRRLGAEIDWPDEGVCTIKGVGPGSFSGRDVTLDFGNSGTGVRLMMGLAAGHDVSVLLTGDASFSTQTDGTCHHAPVGDGRGLRDTGAGGLPARAHVRTQGLDAIDYTVPVASAQVKSAILLAGLNALGTTRIREAVATRDHTERMLPVFGVAVSTGQENGQHYATIEGGQRLRASTFDVPGDPSSAAFLVAAAMICGRSDVTLRNVMMNPTRDGFLRALFRSGQVERQDSRETGTERVCDLRVKGSGRVSVSAPDQEDVASMIDEFPIFAVLAAFGSGTTHVRHAEELRVKESDRIAAIVAMLRANGVNADETSDGFIVEGCDGPPPGGGMVETRHDHRIAMAALIMGTAARNAVTVDDVSMIATSYPGFFADMAALGADMQTG